MYRLDERDSDIESKDEVTADHVMNADPTSSKVELDVDNNRESHLYSNIGHSGYMNHNLDLDPVVLTGEIILRDVDF